MSNLSVDVKWNSVATALRVFVVPLLAGLLISSHAWGQVFTFTREQLIRYTAQNPYERFPDGRPKVPDAILEKVKGLSAEEVLQLEGRGYPNQFSGGWQILHPDRKLVGRALTLQLMPTRPDVADVDVAERKGKGLGSLTHRTALDMLQPGDVFVVDASGASFGGVIGDNLAYYIWKMAAGFVIDGAIRDLDGIFPYDMAGYYRAAVPPAIHQVMVTGINLPIRIGNTTVMPGDVVFGDREGVYFIPPHLVKEIVDRADEIHIHDEWTRKKFAEGKYKSTEIYGSLNPALKLEYQEYLKKHLQK